MKEYVFFFHYNKPESKKQNKPVITIHYRKQCILVNNLVCTTKLTGKINKQQPHFVLKGKATDITIKDGVAYINNSNIPLSPH